MVEKTDYEKFWEVLPDFIVEKYDSRMDDRNDNTNHVFTLIPKKPLFISTKNLIIITQLTSSTLRYYLKKLIDSDLVIRVKYKHQMYYQLTKKGVKLRNG